MIDVEDVDPKVYATCLIVGAILSFIGTAFIAFSFFFINKHIRKNYE